MFSHVTEHIRQEEEEEEEEAVVSESSNHHRLISPSPSFKGDSTSSTGNFNFLLLCGITLTNEQ